MHITETLEEVRIKSRLVEAKSLSKAYESFTKAMTDAKIFPSTKLETREEYVCNRYFGGMSLDTVITILKEHSPEYFV